MKHKIEPSGIWRIRIVKEDDLSIFSHVELFGLRDEESSRNGLIDDTFI